MPINELVLNEKEKYTYLRCMSFVLTLKGEDINEKTNRRLLMEIQMKNINIPEYSIDVIKKTNNTNTIINELKKIQNVKIKAYIIREMIFVAIIDHELKDEEIEKIYKIGVNAGLKEEKISDFFLWAAKIIEWQIEGWNLINSDI